MHVLHDVDFNVYPGEVTALVGDNGAGKSTLVKCDHRHLPDRLAATFVFEGQPVTIHEPKDAAALGIEVVYQDLALCDNLDIVQNMFLGRERSSRRLARRAHDGAPRPRDARRLSVRTVKSVRQRCPASPAASARPWPSPRPCCGTRKVVMLDEPTAALGVAQTEQVLDLVRRLADQGLGVVLISHNMNDVLQVADRICALFLGRVAAEVAPPRPPTRRSSSSSPPGRSGDVGLARAEQVQI